MTIGIPDDDIENLGTDTAVVGDVADELDEDNISDDLKNQRRELMVQGHKIITDVVEAIENNPDTSKESGKPSFNDANWAVADCVLDTPIPIGVLPEKYDSLREFLLTTLHPDDDGNHYEATQSRHHPYDDTSEITAVEAGKNYGTIWLQIRVKGCAKNREAESSLIIYPRYDGYRVEWFHTSVKPEQVEYEDVNRMGGLLHVLEVAKEFVTENSNSGKLSFVSH